jgi:hypothetical protein
MAGKSHVALGALICPVCGKTEEDGTVLLARRIVHGQLATPFDADGPTVTGYGLCKEHRDLCAQGFVHLVEFDASVSTFPLAPSSAHRTGNIASIKREVAAEVINIPIDAKFDFVYIEPGVIEKLRGMMEKSDDTAPVDSGDAGDTAGGPAG